MMGIGPEEAGRMDLWTYQALMWNWNRAHDTTPGPKPLDSKQRDRLSRALEAHTTLN
jgi:hypothetical protein